jgi:ATP-dependent DNA ligase
MKPMMALATTIEDIEAGKLAGYVMEPKLDGMRLLLHFPNGKLSKALTRSGRDVVDRLPQAWVEESSDHFFQFYELTGFEWLDCEFGYGDAAAIDFNKTMRIMGSSPAEAQRKAKELVIEPGEYPTIGEYTTQELPRAFVFDVPEFEGPLWERRQVLKRFVEEPECYADEPNWWEGSVQIIDQWPEFDWQFFHFIVSSMGGEGIMLKNPNSLYEHGKRKAKTWYKLKKYDTFEAFVVGFDPGQGKYEGLIGALIVQTVDGLTIRCSGMSDEERIRITARQERIVRERWVCEVKYFGLTAGTPRHPQWLRWREDKLADDCYWQPKETS